MALICVQLGHCYRKSGATGTNGVDGNPNEQEFATAAGRRAAALLLDAGHQVKVLLADDPDHRYAGDAFVAIHCDGSTSSSARGASVGYRNAAGQDFAARWKRHYAAGGWSGFRPDNYTPALAGYYGTKRAVEQGNRVAFIAECGFLTNPQDEALLSGGAGPERFASALTAAVVELFGGREEDVMASLDDVRRVVREELSALVDDIAAASGQKAHERINYGFDKAGSVIRTNSRELARLGGEDLLKPATDDKPAGLLAQRLDAIEAKLAEIGEALTPSVPPAG